ncbi:MAG TPA: hypothetical protein VK812_13250 [Candidatus Binatus sp.]|nr:hypothetical protein [Candidatus Binatus sp.]
MEDAARGKSFRPDARGLTPLTKLRITLAACLAADGLSEYAMTNKLNPGTKETFAKRRGTLKSFWEDHRGEYEREKGRVSALAKTERDAIAAEAERKIQDELQSRFTRQRRLIH